MTITYAYDETRAQHSAIELAKAITQTADNLRTQIDRLYLRAKLIHVTPLDSMKVFEEGFKAIGEIAEITRTASTEQVARAYGTAMHFAEHK
jgi:hypothetical protein